MTGLGWRAAGATFFPEVSGIKPMVSHFELFWVKQERPLLGIFWHKMQEFTGKKTGL